MEIKEEIVHALTLIAFPLQIIAWICLASYYGQEHLVLAVVLPVFLSLFAHCVYYLKTIMQGEKIYLKHFFYFQVINGVSMWIVFIVKLFGYFYNWWLFLIPLFVQVGACVALYAHVRKTSTDDSARLYNGLIPTNMPREFHAFPTEHKAGNGREGEDRSVILTRQFPLVFIFPLRRKFFQDGDQGRNRPYSHNHRIPIAIAWICLASYYGQEHLVLAVVLPVFLSLFAHCVYYLKTIMQGEKIYLKHFFYFQVINGVSMWIVFIVRLFGYFYSDFWLFLIPLFVQVGTCAALYTHVRKTESNDPARAYNGLLPTNEQSGTYQNVPREFRAFPTEHKARNGFL